MRVKSSKIVAGQEVERTNEFLQLLSIAILKKVWKWGSSVLFFLNVLPCGNVVCGKDHCTMALRYTLSLVAVYIT